MKRLTFRNKDGVVQREFGTTLYDALARLAAYEDTWLEPEDCANYKQFEDEAISSGVPFSRIVEWMKAEADRRLLVLPCKVGSTAYFILEDIEAGAPGFVVSEPNPITEVGSRGFWISALPYDKPDAMHDLRRGMKSAKPPFSPARQPRRRWRG